MARRLALAVLTTALASSGGLAAAGSAQAVGCPAFKNAVQNASNGAVITLNAGLTCHDTYTLPANKNPLSITIRGAGAGATLDGSGKGARIMTGEPAAGKQLHLTIRNLTFRNGTEPTDNGGALSLRGGDLSATLDRDRFFGNTAPSGMAGGAVAISSTGSSRTVSVTRSTFGDGTAAGGNSAGRGGALAIGSIDTGPSITVTRNRFVRNSATTVDGALVLNIALAGRVGTISDNLFARNTSHGFAGGAVSAGTNSPIVLRRNRFLGNRIDSTDVGAFGGGINLTGDGSGVVLDQSGNRFDRNRITRSSQPNFDTGGGGEWSNGYVVKSRNDRFTHNAIPAPSGTGAAEGGGLGIECPAASPPPGAITARLENAVAAGNAAGAGGKGAGVYVGGCSNGPVSLAVLDSTISGNRTSGPGSASGLFGGSDDALRMRNSIVAGNAGGTGLVGFGAGRSVRFTDACAPGVLPGAGNICANPLLRDPFHGNVHERPISPTIDRGANLYIPAGLTTDFEGNKRILGQRVDMGADEFRPKDDPFKGVVIVSKTVKVKNGVATIAVRCPANVPSPCAGNLALVRRDNGNQLGQHGFSIPRGSTLGVSVQISQSGQNSLNQNGSLKTLAKATATDGIGKTRKTSAKVTLTK